MISKVMAMANTASLKKIIRSIEILFWFHEKQGHSSLKISKKHQFISFKR